MAADIEDADNTASVASAGGVGTLLRETRERQGRDVAGVATSLRIRQPYLQAIEDGRFEDLPGATYAVGFVRGYAEFLGLDSSEIVRRFKQENAEFANRAELVFPSAVSEASIPTGALLLFAIIAAAAAYGFWYWYQNREASVADAVPPLPERLAALIHRPVGSGSEMVPVSPADGGKPADSAPATAAAPIVPPVAPTAPSVASSSPQAAAPGSAPHEDVVPPPEDDTSNAAPAPAPTAVAPAAPPPAAPPVAMAPGDAKPADSKEAKAAATKPGKPGKGKEQPAAESAKPSAAPVPPAAEPAAAPSPMPAPAPTQEAAIRGAADPAAPPAGPRSNARVVLRAEENCWIQIRDTSGQVVSSRLLRKGESYTVPRRAGLSLTAGNAGVLTVLVDGKPVQSLGGVGMVRHDVALDPERLVNGPRDESPAARPEAPTE